MTGLECALGAWGAHDRDDPFDLFAELRARGPVHAVTLADGHDAWLIVAHAEARAALNDQRLSKDMHAALASSGEVVAEGLPGPAFARHMLGVDPPDHTRLRRLVSGAFSTRRIESLRPHVQAIVDDLLDGVAAHGPDDPVDLVTSFALPLPFTVICELLGVPLAQRADLGGALRALLSPTSTPEEYELAKQASDTVVAMLTELVATKHRAPGDDLVSALISARDGDERLTQQELLSTIFQLIVAGHDTTASLIENAVVALLRHPEQLATLHAHPDTIPAAVEELLRYDAPAPHATFRYAVEAFEIAGTTIPAGAQVVINLASANRDAEHYTDPDDLDLDRPDSRHLSFGHGIHFCLGAPLAGWKHNSRCTRCCTGSRTCASRSPRTNCTGTTETASSCGGSRSSPSSAGRTTGRTTGPRYTPRSSLWYNDATGHGHRDDIHDAGHDADRIFAASNTTTCGSRHRQEPRVSELEDVMIDEVEGLLARWRVEYAGRPEEESEHLWLLALEREQIVAVAYREEAVAGRIDALDLSADLRAVLRQTLVWIWKDEELHAEYLRGILLRRGGLASSVVVYGRQLQGALSGWVTATEHHRDPRAARLRTGAASALVAVAGLAGRIPKVMQQELRFQTFRRYCELNVVLEMTAELAYRRLVELATNDEERGIFARIRDDEERHTDAFRVLAAAITDSGGLADGKTDDDVCRDLAAISPWFLPAARRPAVADVDDGRPRTFGTGAPVVVRSGTTDDDKLAVLEECLDRTPLRELAARARTAAIRVSFMLGYDRADRSNVNDPELVEGVARYLRRHGVDDVAVLEAPTVYDTLFAHRSVAEVGTLLRVHVVGAPDRRHR